MGAVLQPLIDHGTMSWDEGIHTSKDQRAVLGWWGSNLVQWHSRYPHSWRCFCEVVDGIFPKFNNELRTDHGLPTLGFAADWLAILSIYEVLWKLKHWALFIRDWSGHCIKVHQSEGRNQLKERCSPEMWSALLLARPTAPRIDGHKRSELTLFNRMSWLVHAALEYPPGLSLNAKTHRRVPGRRCDQPKLGEAQRILLFAPCGTHVRLSL